MGHPAIGRGSMLGRHLIKEVSMQGFQTSRPNWLSGSKCRLAIVCSVAVFAVAAACNAQDSKPSESPAVTTSTAQAMDSKANPAKDDKAQKGTSGDSERKKQIEDESAELLNMALALKAEVDKTTKDTLSMNVIKKADQIERLAKSVKEKMKNSGS